MENLNEIVDEYGNTLKILGMTGLMFSDTLERYFIDSEILVATENNIIIFKNKIRYFDKDDPRKLNEDKKNKILHIVLNLLSSKNIKVLLQE
jgi:hypothetical protein